MLLLVLTAHLFHVTAYALKGPTFTGTKARRGVCAVDPKVIPLGSKLHIPGYGWAKAEDTGRLIRGRRLDVWLPSRHLAVRWGVRKLRVKLMRERPALPSQPVCRAFSARKRQMIQGRPKAASAYANRRQGKGI